MAQNIFWEKFSNLTFWAFLVPHVSGKDLRIHVRPSVRPSVRNHFSPKPRYRFFCVLAWSSTSKKLKIWRFSFFVENSKLALFLPKNGQNLLFGHFLTKIWPFWAKYAHFCLFLPNATINVPHFRHRNIFFGLSKNGAIFLGGKILKIYFLGIFWPKFDHFGPNILISAHFSQTLL